MVSGQQEGLPRVTGLRDTGSPPPPSCGQPPGPEWRAECGTYPGLVSAEWGALWEHIPLPFLQSGKGLPPRIEGACFGGGSGGVYYIHNTHSIPTRTQINQNVLSFQAALSCSLISCTMRWGVRVSTERLKLSVSARIPPPGTLV